MSFETKVKRLSHRNWAELSGELLQHAAQLTLTAAGQAPESDLADFPGIASLVVQLPKDGEKREQPLQGLRAAMLHEGIFMLHKSANVLVACHDQAMGGLPTWSLPTGYQAAFFAADSILKLLGVAILEANNVACTLDLWPQPLDSLKGKARNQFEIGTEMQLIRQDRLQHYHRWAILKRILRTTSNHQFDADVLSAVLSIDERDFARQRNHLHYATSWRFKDLHSYYSVPSFFAPEDKQRIISYLDPDSDEFSVALGTILFCLGLTLLKPLAQLSAIVKAETALLATSCAAPRMKLRGAFEGSGIGLLT